MRVTNEIFDERLKIMQAAGDYILSRKADMVKACTQSGLTVMGAELDVGLMHKQMMNLELDRDRIMGKEVGEGTILAAIIPFDIPNFMAPFYCGTAYCAGKDIVMRFGDTIKPVGELWKRAFEEVKAPAIRIDEDLGGPQFGEWAMEEERVRHLILAGSTKVLKAYGKPEVLEKFDSVVMSGPTRPKAIIDKTMESQLGYIVGRTVESAFYNNGQLCAAENEVVPEPEVYGETKKLLIEAVKAVEYGKPENPVGPLVDKWVVIGLATLYDRLKDDPKYEILTGGGYDTEKGIFEPTLVEAPDGIEDNLHFFGPLIFLNGAAHKGEDPIDIVKSDKVHGGYCYIWTQDLWRALRAEAELKQHFGIVRINANIFNAFFDWPFGGFKKSFVAYRREEDGIAEHHGLVHHAYMLTGPSGCV